MINMLIWNKDTTDLYLSVYKVMEIALVTQP